MAPTEGRVARPERWWDCRRGTPGNWTGLVSWPSSTPQPAVVLCHWLRPNWCTLYITQCQKENKQRYL